MNNITPNSNLVTITYIIYCLHLFSAINGLMTPTLIVTAFLTGWPSLIAVILNYAKQDEVRGTYLESHFGWQIRTFWYALLWFAIAVALLFTLIGIPLGIIVFWGTGLWVMYRLIRGLMRLSNRRPMPEVDEPIQ
ncbi:hypothetical protein NO559_07335 [Dasania sp. GY-MA-18]|uniref:Transmembrane protein n=1 Tax=Dasania phycosphaerae TaxID=2950436 RepID=A0A9J6RL01_9GAMM|nr:MULTISPECIES: hypothetical protein [Dasania]MCR8922580.1 hypothetical protein [Dasania sp. GY-MA-18]MCZ0865009.1 hypothetical protein [Dasania phycosphaerae]MCZ0868736.1 hypothetical protein [Dasania phycosphaerae]